MAALASMFRLCGKELQAWSEEEAPWSWTSCGFVFGRWWEYPAEHNEWVDDHGEAFFAEEQEAGYWFEVLRVLGFSGFEVSGF